MTNNEIDDMYLLREWAPLTDLLNKIPTKYKSGIFMSDLSLTCVDVLPDYIALGTNAGIVFWYGRQTKELQRLRCEGPAASISCVKIVSSVDYMVACGTVNGLISIFTIPKSIPNNLPIGLRPKQKSVERYCISDLHLSPITCLEWAKNGMKLFSGDQKGCVVFTELDFSMHLCKSSEILNESYEIVQLSYSHPKLLVSTTYRTIVTEREIGKWNVCQVGRKDRKCLAHLGAIFAPNTFPRLPAKIYCSRPGHRIWVADSSGNVEKTLLFKDTLNSAKISIFLLNPTLSKTEITDYPNFGKVLLFRNTHIVTYTNNVMYILDHNNLFVTSIINKFRGILSASVCDNEIFVLEGQRTLIRLSTVPENVVVKPNDNLANLIANPIISTINSLKEFNYTDHPVETCTDLQSIVNAEECFELPPIKELPTDINSIQIADNQIFHNQLNTDKYIPKINISTGTVENDIIINSSSDVLDNMENKYSKLDIYDKISEQKFEDDILFKSGNKKQSTKKNARKNISNAGTSSNGIGNDPIAKSDGVTTTKPNIMNLSFCTKDDIVVPDMRSPESIQKVIEKKEKLLLKLYDIDVSCSNGFTIIPAIENEMNKIKSKEVTLESANIVYKQNLSEKVVHKVADIYVEKGALKAEDTIVESINESPKEVAKSLPKCVNIPNVWNLENITVAEIVEDNNVSVSHNNTNMSSDIIGSDWEII